MKGDTVTWHKEKVAEVKGKKEAKAPKVRVRGVMDPLSSLSVTNGSAPLTFSVQGPAMPRALNSTTVLSTKVTSHKRCWPQAHGQNAMPQNKTGVHSELRASTNMEMAKNSSSSQGCYAKSHDCPSPSRPQLTKPYSLRS